jgi:hypothetical protein
MKNCLLFTLLLSLPIWAQDPPLTKKELEEKVKTDMELVKDAATKITGGVVQVQEDKRIEKLITNSNQFKTCKDDYIKEFETNPNAEVRKIASCSQIIGIDANGNIQDKASFDKLIKQLNVSFYQADGVTLQTSKNYDVIKKYMEQRLQNTLYGEDKTTYDFKSHGPDKRKVATVDHEVFYEIYKTQLSKSFLLDVGAYCSETYHIASKPGSQASSTDYNGTKKNEESYQNNLYGTDKTGFQSLGTEYNNCLNSLSCQCYGPNVGKSCDGKTHISNPDVKNKSCNLISRLRQMKLQVQNLDKSQAEFASLSSKDHIKANNVQYDKMAQDKTIDDLTTFTSGDYDKALGKDGSTGTGLVTKKEQDLLDECKTALSTGTDFDEKKCKNVNSVDKSKVAEVNFQEKLKNEILEAELAAAKENNQVDKDRLKAFLEKQQLTEAEINKKLNGDLDILHKELSDKLKAERESIIAEINNKIKKESVVTDKSSGSTKVDSLTDTTQVFGRAETQEDRTRRLLHYTNVVSAYIEACEASKLDANKNCTAPTFYTKSLTRELAGASTQIQKDHNQYFGQIKEGTQTQTKSDNSPGASLFSIDSINKIIGDTD